MFSPSMALSLFGDMPDNLEEAVEMTIGENPKEAILAFSYLWDEYLRELDKQCEDGVSLPPETILYLERINELLYYIKMLRKDELEAEIQERLKTEIPKVDIHTM